MDRMFSMWTQSCTQQRQGRSLHKCKALKFRLFPSKPLDYIVFYPCRSYPVYAVGDYAGGQQYYATSSSNFTASSTSSNGNAAGNSYIVPVDEAILGVNQSRGSPQTISSVSGSLFYFYFPYLPLKIFRLLRVDKNSLNLLRNS